MTYLKKTISPVIFLIIVLSILEILSRLGIIDPIILPSPSSILMSSIAIVGSANFFTHFTVTLTEMGIGYLIGCSVGFALGILTGAFKSVKNVAQPYVIALASLPKVVLAPLMLVWFGYGMGSKIGLVVVSTLFPVYINTLAGIASAKEEEILLLKSYVASPWEIFTKLTFPSALPYIFTGLKNSLTLAFVSVIVAEFLGAKQGLGVLVKMYNESFQFSLVFAIVLIMTLMGLLFFVIAEKIDKKVVFWRKPTIGD